MKQIYKRTLAQKCDFNKVELEETLLKSDFDMGVLL